MKLLMMFIYLLGNYWYVVVAATVATTYAVIMYGYWEEVVAASVLGVLSLIGVLVRFVMPGPI